MTLLILCNNALVLCVEKPKVLSVLVLQKLHQTVQPILQNIFRQVAVEAHICGENQCSEFMYYYVYTMIFALAVIATKLKTRVLLEA